MKRSGDRELVVGLDVGTAKVMALVAECRPGEELEIIGLGVHASRGLKKGVVVNIDSTVQSICGAIQEAELMAGCEIHSVYASISGSHVRSLNSTGIVAIRDREVSRGDVERVIDAARAVALPDDQRLLHVLPQEFIIDRQDGVRDPVGMSGVRLEVRVHLVTGASSSVQNLQKSICRCGLQVDDIILEQLASSQAVLLEDERELGVCLVDIGAGTTSITVYRDGAVQHTAVLPIAGDQVTNDLAVALRTPRQFAEELKVRYACALGQLSNPEENLQVPGVGDRSARRLERQTLVEVVQPRYEELFGLVRTELERSGFENSIAAGVVLSGGSARMEGVVELAEEIFRVPVRTGVPRSGAGLNDTLCNPAYAAGVGLLYFGRNIKDRAQARDAGGFWKRCGEWFRKHL